MAAAAPQYLADMANFPTAAAAAAVNANANANANADGRAPPPSHTRTYQGRFLIQAGLIVMDLSADTRRDKPASHAVSASKECYFSATRRKRKPADGGEGSLDGDEEDLEIRNGRKRLRSPSSQGGGPPPPSAGSRFHASLLDNAPRHSPTLASSEASVSGFSDQPLTPGGSLGRAQPLRRPTSDSQTPIPLQRPFDGDMTQPSTGKGRASGGGHLTNDTAVELLKGEVYSGHDALNLLYEAAGRSGDINHRRTGSQSSFQASPTITGDTPRSYETSTGGGRARVTQWAGDFSNFGRFGLRGPTPIDPALTGIAASMSNEDDVAMQSALKAWSNFRFVRAGWFMAKEAIAYVEYFYTYLAPLTPISPPSFRSPADHARLLSEEPVLTITILTIASRHMNLSGPGAISRSYTVHEKLWTYLRGMIGRMFWGQEQFGGGFCGAGASVLDAQAQNSSTLWKDVRKGSLRTLGTVESLMLLTEWHPRALHFPPGDDADELIIKDDPSGPEIGQDASAGTAPGGLGGRRMGSWLEPAWRSDRMCWMLLGNAMTLSFELGVFDDIDQISPSPDDPVPSEYDSESYRVRSLRVQKLLLVYLTQTSGRLGWASMVPKPLDDFVFSQGSGPRNKRMMQKAPTGQIRHQGYQKDNTLWRETTEESIQQCWIAITLLMKQGNEMLFPSRQHTRDIIRNGRYVALLEYFQPMLKVWWTDFVRLDIPKYMRHILTIEYEYARVYLNSLSLQAVIERFTNNVGDQTSIQTGQQNPSGAANQPWNNQPSGNASYANLLTLYQGNEIYIKEVVDASRNLLRTVVDGLLPGDYLKHLPVRTYFRIVSVSIILLKTFALGAKEDEVAISLGLMDSAVHALRTCVVDDVHLASQYADLLDTLTQSLRSRFVRVSTNTSGRLKSKSHSPFPGASAAAAGEVPNMQHQQHQPHSLRQHQGPNYDPHSSLAAGSSAHTSYPQHQHHQQQQQRQQNPYAPKYNDTANNANLVGVGGFTPNPLEGISTDPIDLNESNLWFMPPPTYAFGGGGGGGGSYDNESSLDPNNSNNAYVSSNNNNNNNSDENNNSGGSYPDWLALPLDPLVRNVNSFAGSGGGLGVSQTTYGPDVGGHDLLEVLLSEMESVPGGGVGGGGGG
ncbi:MAG: hypothetical protein M1819_000434 [Sarea resinae]|nr:MAG: hypothetical protein M1819_000434 [Sarea resinae]